MSYRRSTPTNILLGESKCTSVVDRAKFLCNAYLSKLYSNSNLPVSKLVFKICSNLKNNPMAIVEYHSSLLRRQINATLEVNEHIRTKSNIQQYLCNYDTLLTEIPFELTLGTTLDVVGDANEVFLEHRKDAVEGSISIFTDGSKRSDAILVDAAFFCPEFNARRHVSLHKVAFIFTAESVALGLAIDFAMAKSIKNVYIYTDSLSVLYTLSSVKAKSRNNLYMIDIFKK